MKELRLREFEYECGCGHRVNIFCDSGVPQELYKCRKCGNVIKRREVQ